jgi:hypothetical protein
MHIAGPETRKTPPEYQARITRMFGVNRFGEPNFKIVWNQSNFIRMGNVWHDSRGNEQVGYKDTYQGDGQPCWLILKWHPPEHYGSPNTYYRETYDNHSRRYITGEYPWKGRYEIMQALISKQFIGGQMQITHMPLCHFLIDTVIPMILAWQQLSLEEQQAATQLAEQEKVKAEHAENAEKMMENMPTWIHPVSYSRQGCRTSILDQKMHQIQKAWDRLSRRGLRPVFQKGFAQGNAPRPLQYK